MNESILLLPAIDPIPLPAPVWLLKGLLLLTFLLHIIAMNWLLGGSLIALIAAAKSRQSPQQGTLLKDVTGMLPTLVAATVTLGVAALLFVQVLYGHLVYTSSVALGWWWWWVIPLLIIAYYMLYYAKFKLKAFGGRRTLLYAIACLILIWISFVFSNNFNLSAQPARFSAMLTEDTSGWWLNLSDPSTFPRWLHMVLGAMAVAGVGMMWLGRARLKTSRDYGTYCMGLGYRWFAFPTMANILVGFLFMMTLPREIMMRMMGQGVLETALWMIGFAAAIGTLTLLKRASVEPESSHLLYGTVLIGVTMVTMVLLRDLVRSAYLKGLYSLSLPEVQPMWGAIAMFGLVFVIGVGVFIWLVKTYYTGGKKHAG